jgi:hypothetical protein
MRSIRACTFGSICWAGAGEDMIIAAARNKVALVIMAEV